MMIHMFFIIYCTLFVSGFESPGKEEWDIWLNSKNLSIANVRYEGNPILIGGITLCGIDKIIEDSLITDKIAVLPSPWDIAQDEAKMVTTLRDLASSRVNVIVDPFAFDFLMELKTVFPQASAILLVNEPSLFLQQAKKERRYRCYGDFLLSSTRLNARRAKVDEFWIAAFGVNCPSDLQLLKQYHYKNLLARLLMLERRQLMHVVDIQSGFNVAKVCTQLPNELLSFCQNTDIARSIQPGSYASRLEAISTLDQAHAFFWNEMSKGIGLLIEQGTDDTIVKAINISTQHCYSSDAQQSMIIGTGLSKTGTTSVSETLSSWGVVSGHWIQGHNLYRIMEAEGSWHVARKKGRNRSNLQILNSLTRHLEAILDLPIPSMLPEFLLIRSSAVSLYTDRPLSNWLQSFQAWLGKSCRSPTFDGCPGTPPTIVHNNENTKSRIIQVDVCPAGTMAFGVTCPSIMQSIKRYLLHQLMTRVIAPSKTTVYENLSKAKDTSNMCASLRQALLSTGQSQLPGRSCANVDKVVHNRVAIEYIGRHATDLSDSLDCKSGQAYIQANVNAALHGRSKGRRRKKDNAKRSRQRQEMVK
jgi:hypothetical protein